MRRQGIAFELPDPGSWRALSMRGEWSGLRQEETKSELWSRHTVARRTVTIGECEKEARESLQLLRTASEVTSSRRLSLSDGYEGRLQVSLSLEGGGRVEVFLAGVQRCLSLVFVAGHTPGFPERLQFMERKLASSLRLLSLDERGLGKRL